MASQRQEGDPWGGTHPMAWGEGTVARLQCGCLTPRGWSGCSALSPCPGRGGSTRVGNPAGRASIAGGFGFFIEEPAAGPCASDPTGTWKPPAALELWGLPLAPPYVRPARPRPGCGEAPRRADVPAGSAAIGRSQRRAPRDGGRPEGSRPRYYADGVASVSMFPSGTRPCPPVRSTRGHPVSGPGVGAADPRQERGQTTAPPHAGLTVSPLLEEFLHALDKCSPALPEPGTARRQGQPGLWGRGTREIN